MARQLNVRISDEDAAALTLFCARNGVTPSDLVRRMIRDLGAQKAKLGRVHLDILTAMAQDRAVSKNILDLINVLGIDGNQVATALAELEQLGHLMRASVPGRSYFLSASGLKRAEER